MGYIDTHSEYSLYDVVDGTLGMGEDYQPEGSVDFYGLHIYPVNNGGKYNVQYDGHMGTLMDFEAEDYDDPLELVDDLMGHILELEYLSYNEGKEELVNYAGKILTYSDEKADANPELYMKIPENI